MSKIPFKQLFSFSSMQAQSVLRNANQVFSQYGIKVLFTVQEEVREGTTGKLLILTPKACGNAPKRNRARRRIKAIVYEQQLHTKRGIYTVIVYPSFHEFSVQKLQTILRKALAQ